MDKGECNLLSGSQRPQGLVHGHCRSWQGPDKTGSKEGVFQEEVRRGEKLRVQEGSAMHADG